MPKKHRTISTFLIVGIPFIFILACTYSNYNVLIEADFITDGTKYEAGDLDDLCVDKQLNFSFMLSESFLINSPEMDLHGVLIRTSFQVFSINSLSSILRC